jgi:hypothetical protein
VASDTGRQYSIIIYLIDMKYSLSTNYDSWKLVSLKRLP